MQIKNLDVKLADFENQMDVLFKAEAWEDSKLMSIKEDLNKTKNRMDAMDIR